MYIYIHIYIYYIHIQMSLYIHINSAMMPYYSAPSVLTQWLQMLHGAVVHGHRLETRLQLAWDVTQKSVGYMEYMLDIWLTYA